MQHIPELTRAKLAQELLIAPSTLHASSRRGPCLRKLVLWSNLLAIEPAPSSTPARVLQPQRDSLSQQQQQQQQQQSLPPPPPPPAAQLELARPQQAAASGSREQAEYDWFEHLMEEIDDSDSESECSEGDYPLVKLSPSPSITSAHASGPEARTKRGCPTEQEHLLSGNTRRRLLLARSTKPRRRRARRAPRPEPLLPPPSSSSSSSSSLATLPHWGFLCTRPHAARPADPHSDAHLPSLVPIKTRFRFESAAVHPLSPSSCHSSSCPDNSSLAVIDKLPSPQFPLAAIDFRPYDFIVAATAQLHGRTVHVKYLIGPARVTCTSILDSLHDDDKCEGDDDGAEWEAPDQLARPPGLALVDSLLAPARHTGLLVTALHLVCTRAPAPPQSIEPSSSFPSRHHPLWKVFALRPIPTRPSS